MTADQSDPRHETPEDENDRLDEAEARREAREANIIEGLEDERSGIFDE